MAVWVTGAARGKIEIHDDIGGMARKQMKVIRAIMKGQAVQKEKLSKVQEITEGMRVSHERLDRQSLAVQRKGGQYS